MPQGVGRIANSGQNFGVLVGTQAFDNIFCPGIRGVAGRNSDAFAPNLAVALNNLAVIYAKLARHEQAGKLGAEATEIGRRNLGD